MDDLHRPSAQHVARANDHRIADPLRDLPGLVQRVAGSVGRLLEAKLMEQYLEASAVLGAVDGIGRRADDRNILPFEGPCEAERSLASELDDDADERPPRHLGAGDRDDILDGERLEIEPVRGVVVRRYGLWVAVDHDGLDACFLQTVAGVNAAVVELDPLSDAVGSSAEDDHLAGIAGIGLVFGLRSTVSLVAAVHVGRARGELGGTGVDSLEYRNDAQTVHAAF